jgi:hypothetical protein
MNFLGNQCINERILLKLISKNQDVKMWSVFNTFRVGYNINFFFEHGFESSGSVKEGNCWTRCATIPWRWIKQSICSVD